jgi:hypothetical protein
MMMMMMMIVHLKTLSAMKGSWSNLLLSRHLSGGTEENQEGTSVKVANYIWVR